MEKGCDRLLTPPQTPGSIRITPFGFMLCPFLETPRVFNLPRSSSPTGPGKPRDILGVGPEVLFANQTKGRNPGPLFSDRKAFHSTHTTCVALLTNAENGMLPLRESSLPARPADNVTPPGWQPLFWDVPDVLLSFQLNYAYICPEWVYSRL